MDASTPGILRSMLAGLLAAGFAFALRLPRPSTSRQWGLLLLSGVASFAIWPMLLSVGLARTTANHAALIMAVLPMFTGLIAAAVSRRLPRGGWWFGVGAALAGTVLLVIDRSDGEVLHEGGSVAGDAIILGGSVICALGYVAGGKLTPVLGSLATTFWGLAAALVVLVPGFLLIAPRTDWSAVSTGGWASIAYMTLLSSLVGYSAWFWALGHGGIARIGSWQLAQPMITVALAVWLLGERLTLPLALAGVVILAGTVVAHRWSPSRSAD